MQDSKSEAQVDDRSHEGEVKENSDHCALFDLSFKNVNHKLPYLEEERDEHEDEDRDGPSYVAVLHQLEKGEEVRCHHRVSNDVDDALVEPFT